MGTTLENGVYLPSEGERNCYAGLKTNWEILDQKVADVTALQQAVAGALHRQIVASLPTTDIDPNTIYMILSGTSATENVYNEYMYVNNAWELIGTSATDLTNYYTKAEVDGKLLLKASASDLTSHTGDTTIHVTASDKAKWTNSANTVVLRLAKTALTPSSSTNAFSNLDDSTALKVGDKVMDTAGVLFSITAIDTQNSTFTIGTALIDLAQDSDVVHKSGNETVAGVKTITDSSLDFKSTSAEYGVSAGDSSVIFRDKNNLQTFKIYSRVFFSGIDNNLVSFFLTQKVNNTYYTSNGIQLLANTGNKDVILRPILANSNADGLSVSLGASDRRWSKIYGAEYYYGSNNVEFSTKFVTTDTAQTISGSKTFSSDLTVANTDTTANTPNLNLRNYKVDRGTNDTGVQTITFFDKNGKALTLIESRKISNGNVGTNILTYNTDDSNNTVSGGVSIIKSKTDTNFAPNVDNAVTCGRALAKWSDVQTYKVNSLEPSSLSLPSGRNTRVDISSYFTNLGNGDTNAYNVPANGYIYMQLKDIATVHCFDFENATTTVADYIQTFSRGNDGQLYVLFPVKKDHVFKSTWYTTTTVTITGVYFIPCQGNV